jgi:hypothetical protein
LNSSVLDAFFVDREIQPDKISIHVRRAVTRVAGMHETERPLSDFTLVTFAEHVGDWFRVHSESGPVELILVDAAALPASGNRERPQPFSILFRGPASPRLFQRIHAFDHDAIGKFEMFIVPVAPDELGPRYEAVFN